MFIVWGWRERRNIDLKIIQKEGALILASNGRDLKDQSKSSWQDSHYNNKGI